MPIRISIHVYLREGESDHIYRQPQARGSLLTKEIEDIGGFMAKNGVDSGRLSIAGVQSGFGRWGRL
jgi:hypothetical protein